MIDLDKIEIDPKARANINYVKARIAIEEAFTKRAERRAAKMVIVEFLNGKVEHPEEHTANKSVRVPNFVVFPDDSRARF